MEELSKITWSEGFRWALQTGYFYLPAIAANMAASLAAAKDERDENKQPIPRWYNTPIWAQVLGRNKTWRGLIVGIFAAWFVFFIQQDLAVTQGGMYLSVLPYRGQSAVIMALLFGGGALAGDALKSMAKRALGKPAGSPWYPMDQVDHIIGATFFVMFAYPVQWHLFLIALFATLLLHPLINQIAYKLGWKAVPW